MHETQAAINSFHDSQHQRNIPPINHFSFTRRCNKVNPTEHLHKRGPSFNHSHSALTQTICFLQISDSQSAYSSPVSSWAPLHQLNEQGGGGRRPLAALGSVSTRPCYWPSRATRNAGEIKYNEARCSNSSVGFQHSDVSIPLAPAVSAITTSLRTEEELHCTPWTPLTYQSSSSWTTKL